MKHLEVTGHIIIDNNLYAYSGTCRRVIVDNLVTYYYKVGIIGCNDDYDMDCQFTFTGDTDISMYQISYKDFLYYTDNLYYKQNSNFIYKFLEKYQDLEVLSELISDLFSNFTYMCQEHYSIWNNL